MKKISVFLSGLLLLLSLTACSDLKENEPYSSDNTTVSENNSESTTQSSEISGGDGSESSTESGSASTTQSSETFTTSAEKTPDPQIQPGTGSNDSTESSTSIIPQQSSETSGDKEKPHSAQSGTGSDNSTESGTSTTLPQSTVTPEIKPDQTQSTQTVTPSQPEENPQTSDKKENSEYMMNIKIGDNLLTAALEENSSAKALIELLKNGPVTVHMSDYAGMEKVGTLPVSLPRNDEHIDTDACDLILYQGNQFVIYYGTNSWSLTRLGKITNTTKSELKKILGTGDVTAVLSLS